LLAYGFQIDSDGGAVLRILIAWRARVDLNIGKINTLGGQAHERDFDRMFCMQAKLLELGCDIDLAATPIDANRAATPKRKPANPLHWSGMFQK